MGAAGVLAWGSFGDLPHVLLRRRGIAGGLLDGRLRHNPAEDRRLVQRAARPVQRSQGEDRR